MSSLILHELTPSPNNVKVRIALGFKGLPYERQPLELQGAFPFDRSGVVALSGQPRLPVLQHGEAIIPESTAILRYLDANFRDTPSLFSADFAESGEIEQWERWRMTLGPALGPIFGEVVTGQVKPETGQQCSALFHELTAPLEEALGESEYLVGGRLTSADCHVAPMVNLAALTDEMAQISPFYQAFRAHVDLGPGREKTRAWISRVLAHDPVLQPAGAGA